jgi:hypothetical protein
MYVPPFDSLLRALGTTKEGVETSTEIAIPTGLLKLLLQLAVAHSDFDEEEYLRANPDVNQAVRRGDVESGQMQGAAAAPSESTNGDICGTTPMSRRPSEKGRSSQERITST